MTNTETVKYIKLNEEVKIKLYENASTGYLWKHVTEDSFSMKGKFLADQNLSSVPGSGNNFIFCMAPKNAGEHKLRFELIRPWEKHTTPIEVYEEVIFVSG